MIDKRHFNCAGCGASLNGIQEQIGFKINNIEILFTLCQECLHDIFKDNSVQTSLIFSDELASLYIKYKEVNTKQGE